MAGQDNLRPFNKGYDPRRGSKPKGSIHISTHIQKMLNDKDFTSSLLDDTDKPKKYEGAPIKAIISAAVTKAVDGDDKAREWLAKYGYSQKIEHEHSGEIKTRTLTEDELNDRIGQYLERHTTN